MRVISKETSLVSSPTSGVSYGEFEDYTIDLQAPASGYSWSDGSSVVGTTNPLTVSPLSNTTYTVTVTHASGCTVVGSINIISNTLPTAPTASNSTQCGYGVPTATVTSTSGQPTPVFKWYAASSGGTALQTGTSNTYTNAIIATTTFYVTVTV